MGFQRATKSQAKLRLAVDGPAGSGKTYTALLLAKSLGGRTAVIDSEHGAASKYANLFAFDTDRLEEYSLKTYIRSIADAKAAGYEVLVIDSLSHSWNGKGGALEQVDKASNGNSFTAWKNVTPLTHQLIESILSYPGHVIATMRSSMDYVLEKDERTGKQVPKKVGLAPVARKGTEYEFDVIMDMSLDGNMTISKTRCPALRDGVFPYSDTEKVAQTLKAWLSDGVEVTARDTLADDIRGADSRESLIALVPRMKALPPEELSTLGAAFKARLTEFPEVE